MSENLNKKRRSGVDVMTVGFALFAMFFGAGNLIFPPELGVKAGPDWWIGVVCFILADAGIALIALFSLIKYDGDIEKITGTVGQKMGVVINAIMILCIGVLVATPRTAATTFEMGFTPITGIDSKIALAVFSVVYFAIVLVLTIKPSRVVDIVGNILTPVLLITLAIIIVIGFVAPAADIQPAMVDTTVKDGIYNGYQTLRATLKRAKQME